jgi:hypothetical protein
MFDEMKRKAKEANKKKAELGPDLNLREFSLAAKPLEKISKLSELQKEEKKSALNVGIEIKERKRSGSFFQINHSVIYENVKQDGLRYE